MNSIFQSAGLAAFLVFSVSGCAPPGQYNDRVGLLWPRADQQLSTVNQTEIESLLARLGYFNGTIDGAITPKTRAAIKQYQDAVGATPNGVISATLLRSLRSTAGIQVTSKVTSAETNDSPIRAQSVGDGDDGNDDDSGGGGNDGGGNDDSGSSGGGNDDGGSDDSGGGSDDGGGDDSGGGGGGGGGAWG
ncbi:MAG: peptidoglycan-binding domain-containing protein [Litoreibacter sp.]